MHGIESKKLMILHSHVIFLKKFQFPSLQNDCNNLNFLTYEEWKKHVRIVFPTHAQDT